MDSARLVREARAVRLVRKLLLVLLTLFVLLGLVLWLFAEPIVLALMTPTGPFTSDVDLPAPDYADPAAWSALPEREDAGDAAPADDPSGDQRTLPVDVFYIHPTTHIGAAWNAGVGDPGLNADTDRVATRLQATAFNACCAVYAPRYRQASGLVFTQPSADGDRAADLAYQDVAAAFAHYLRTSGERPFIIAGHSQGSIHGLRLLREVIAPGELRQRLVAAYLIGGPILLDAIDLPVCAAPEQTGCVVGWNARAPGFTPNAFELRDLPATRPGEPGAARPRICVNPITWTQGGAAPASANAGAVFLETEPPTILPGFASAECVAGTLQIAEIGTAPRDLMSRILDRTLGAGNLHAIEVQMFWRDLRRNAQARSAAFLRARG